MMVPIGTEINSSGALRFVSKITRMSWLINKELILINIIPREIRALHASDKRLASFALSDDVNISLPAQWFRKCLRLSERYFCLCRMM